MRTEWENETRSETTAHQAAPLQRLPLISPNTRCYSTDTAAPFGFRHAKVYREYPDVRAHGPWRHPADSLGVTLPPLAAVAFKAA
jgi:hypothetical protein